MNNNRFGGIQSALNYCGDVVMNLDLFSKQARVNLDGRGKSALPSVLGTMISIGMMLVLATWGSYQL